MGCAGSAPAAPQRDGNDPEEDCAVGQEREAPEVGDVQMEPSWANPVASSETCHIPVTPGRTSVTGRENRPYRSHLGPSGNMTVLSLLIG
jgi:hypothetical protein